MTKIADLEILALDDGLGLDKGMQVTLLKDSVSFNCYDEWSGSTETGFGAEVTTGLNHEKVKQLYDFLGKWLILKTK